MAKRILLVDDEPLILKGLKFSLEQDGYETDTAADGEEALAKMRNGGYDIVLLDVMLPKLSGIEVCQNIRETSNVPIIMLTAKGEDMDKILGLEYGADDYMTKPFNILEVKARIKSILRRTGAAPEAPKLELTVRDITINIGNRSVVAHGEPVNLTVKEFDLLQLFMNNPGKVYSRDELLETIWGFDYLGDVRTVDVHIRRLREKIEKDSTKPAYIMTNGELDITLRNRVLGSIRSRMVAIYLLVTTVALFAISFVISGLVESFLVTQRTETQSEETMRLALELAPKLDPSDTNELYDLIVERAQTMNGRILVLDVDAVVRADSASYQNGFQLPYREVRDVLVAGKQSSYGFHKIDRTDDAENNIWTRAEQTVWAVYYTAPITLDGFYVGAVLFSTLLQDVEDAVNSIITKITVAFLGVVLVMAGLSFAMSNVVTKPILELTNAIRRMGKQGGGVRVEVHGTDETVELGRAFNRMSEQIEAHDRVRDEFVSNASHELKTPLSTMKLLSESILYEETRILR